jgi:biotin transport system substrate-specific component
MLIPAAVGLVVYYSVGAVYFYLIKNLYVGEAVPFQLIVVQYCLITVPPDFLLCVLASILSARLKEPFRQMLTG